jgi:hypothetical protein
MNALRILLTLIKSLLMKSNFGDVMIPKESYISMEACNMYLLNQQLRRI